MPVTRDDATEDTATSGDDSWIGRRVAQLRRERGWTLAGLADKVGLSSTQLSRIESGARQSSVGTLIEIARAFGISLSELVEEVHASPFHLVRSGERRPRETVNGTLATLSGRYPGLQAVHLHIPAGSGAPAARHRGEEWLYVLTGSVEITIDGTVLTLDAGDAVHFQAHTSHSVRNTGGDPAEMLLLSTPGR